MQNENQQPKVCECKICNRGQRFTALLSKMPVELRPELEALWEEINNKALAKSKELNTYTCSTFTGHWPVGVAAVVKAVDEADALEQLNTALKHHGLDGDAKLEDIHLFIDGVRILCDGDY